MHSELAPHGSSGGIRLRPEGTLPTLHSLTSDLGMCPTSGHEHQQGLAFGKVTWGIQSTVIQTSHLLPGERRGPEGREVLFGSHEARTLVVQGPRWDRLSEVQGGAEGLQEP